MSFYHQLWDCFKKDKFVVRVNTLLYKKILIKTAITIVEHDPARERLKFKINFEIPGGSLDYIVYDEQGFGTDDRNGVIRDKITEVEEIFDPVIAIDCEYRFIWHSNVPGTVQLDRKDTVRKYLIGAKEYEVEIEPKEIFKEINDSICGEIIRQLETLDFSSIIYYENEKESAYLYSLDGCWGSLKLELLNVNTITIQ